MSAGPGAQMKPRGQSVGFEAAVGELSGGGHRVTAKSGMLLAWLVTKFAAAPIPEHDPWAFEPPHGHAHCTASRRTSEPAAAGYGQTPSTQQIWG